MGFRMAVIFFPQSSIVTLKTGLSLVAAVRKMVAIICNLIQTWF